MAAQLPLCSTQAAAAAPWMRGEGAWGRVNSVGPLRARRHGASGALTGVLKGHRGLLPRHVQPQPWLLGAQLLPLLLLGLQASPAQPWLQFLDRKLKLKRLWPKEALSRSSPAATSFPPIWLHAASTFSRSGALPVEQHDEGLSGQALQVCTQKEGAEVERLSS